MSPLTERAPIDEAARAVIRLMMPSVSQAGVALKSPQYKEVLEEVLNEWREGGGSFTATELHYAVLLCLRRVAAHGFDEFPKGV